jgi:16S rRNA (cytidine1402-2'-O)-methyltransferase
VLYLVATPIGNLKDITLRAIETLHSCDYILCEDTRHSLILLKHISIQKPLVSFHRFSEASKEDQVIQDLISGKTICLISDAGTPGISDPGARLVQRCAKEEIEVIPIPGACAAITAICASGLNTDRFQFVGFLPRQTNALKNTLKEILLYPAATISYESPERIEKVLRLIHELAPNRQIVIGRELTKKFEEFLRGTAKSILDEHGEKKFKGEIVLMIDGNSGETVHQFTELSVKELVEKIQQENSLTLNEAIKEVAKIRSVPKRQIYNEIHA